MNTPPFLRIEVTGMTGDGDGKVIITRQEPDSGLVAIETSHRTVFCPATEVRAALESITENESKQVGGN